MRKMGAHEVFFDIQMSPRTPGLAEYLERAEQLRELSR
jgi:hypothetical protein